MAKKQKMMTSDFYCTKCGRKGVPVARKQGQLREPGHLKKLYCLYCKEEVNHAEIREIGGYTYEDFLEEFEAGRFIDGQRQSIPELLSCSCLSCEYNKDGKCWNSNNSLQCGHKPVKEGE